MAEIMTARARLLTGMHFEGQAGRRKNHRKKKTLTDRSEVFFLSFNSCTTHSRDTLAE
jgi:hypothetical protein